MLSEYSQASLRRARYDILSEDKAFYGEIPSFEGVYAHAPTLSALISARPGKPS